MDERAPHLDFDALVQNNQNKLVHMARKWVGSDAEDVVQDSYLRVFRKYENLDHDPKKMGQYLRMAVRNRSYDVLRRRPPVILETDHTQKMYDESGSIFDGIASPEPVNAEEHEERDAQLETLFKNIAYLPENLRNVAQCVCIDGLSIRDTASTLGIKEGSVRTRLTRVRIQLRSMVSHISA